ncbi:MAG: DUF4926 domain-containing protein [Candidatus Rokubacteria bacterium]|nr:DUF4926 domain-containing protein [Candidatus Rokubacteria bacterium]
MKEDIHMHDLVALIEDVPATHFETGRPIVLRRGQIGTVVMTYGSSIFEIEFAGRDGKAYAILPIDVSKLMLLRDTPDYAVS